VTQIIYTDRSRILAAQRCRRLRYLEYHEGEQGVGLSPARKSSHLVVGGAVHVGLAYLLSSGQSAVDSLLEQRPDLAVAEVVAELFRSPEVRRIEDEAVGAALTAFQSEWHEGVELDPEEAKSRQAGGGAGPAGQPEVINDLLAPAPGPTLVTPLTTLTQQLRGSLQAESPIVVEFGDFALPLVPPSGFTGIPHPESGASIGAAVAQAVAYQPFDQDQWLREELAALVEGMVRCWSRRRWQNLLENFSVIEVEHEGQWVLSQWDDPAWTRCPDLPGYEWRIDEEGHRRTRPVEQVELHFLSRPDALLLERSTGYLYLQSFKTTGAWDRRKELDAQVDMQGLSEAVDVERRFGEAWLIATKEAQVVPTGNESVRLAHSTVHDLEKLEKLVSPRVARWLSTLPDPPTILGVRYEYLLKGARREDKKAQPGEPRWNQESVLVRAYCQEGITSEDRRWAWTYDWKDEGGKGRRLDYRSWRKQAVWKSMAIRDWVDLLDEGKVQEGALDDEGNPLDALAAQLVPVVVAYRSADEMRDLLEQMESQEVQVAKDVEEVRRAEREGGAGAKRSALNRLFAQSRNSCSYPGLCAYRTTATQPGFCFGGQDPFNDPSVLEHFRVREANHPQELVQIENS
jgi:hypothetical protein